MNRKSFVIALAFNCLIILGSGQADAKQKSCGEPTATLLVTGLEELQGSAIGPGGALFVTAPLTGSIWRVDPKTGAVTLFATGLPPRNPDPFFGGASTGVPSCAEYSSYHAGTWLPDAGMNMNRPLSMSADASP